MFPPLFYFYIISSNHPIPHMLPLTTKKQRNQGETTPEIRCSQAVVFFCIQGTVKFPRSISSCGSFTLPHTPAPALFCLISVFLDVRVEARCWRFFSLHPWNLKITQIEKEDHFPNLPFLCSMFVFQGVEEKSNSPR